MTREEENQLNQKKETNRDTDYFENGSYYCEPDDDKVPDYDPRKDPNDDDDDIPLCRYTQQFQGNYRLTTVPENLGFQGPSDTEGTLSSQTTDEMLSSQTTDENLDF